MRVLIVDDEEQILRMLKQHLVLEGLDVTTETRPTKALELHQKNPFAVVVTDLSMPEMTGVQLTKLIKKSHPLTQVYIMSGYSTLLNLRDCIAEGATDFFLKPFKDLSEMVQAVREGLRRYERWSTILSVSGGSQTEEVA